MATLPNQSATAGGQSLNLFMAGMAAAALAFLTYAMPDSLFSGLVERSGLPNLIAAAEPPLGMKARGAAVAAVAVLVFALVMILFRAIDRISRGPAKAKAQPAEAEAPRLRRADAHPDAPARRPLLAGRDLGDYVEADADEFADLSVDEERFADLEVSPLPGFLAAEPEAPAAIEEAPAFEPAPAAVEHPGSDQGFDSLVAQLPDIGAVSAQESISELMQRLESGLAQRDRETETEPARAEAQPVPHWLEADSSLPADDADSGQAEEMLELGEPEPIDFAALRASGRHLSDFGEVEPAAEAIEAAEPPAPERFNEYGEVEAEQPFDLADFRSPDPEVSDYGAFEPEAQDEAPEVEAADEAASLGYASHRTRKPLDLSQPVQQAPEPPFEEPPAPVEPQVGHRLRGTINDLRRIAARG